MARFQPHLPTSTYSPHLAPHSWAHTSNRTLGICFSDKFIPKSELPHLGQVIWIRGDSLLTPGKRQCRDIDGRGGGWGARAFRKRCVSRRLFWWLWAGFVCRYARHRVFAWGAIRGTKPQPYICFSSFALRRPGFDVLLLRRLDGGNNGNSKKCQLDYCLRVGTSPGSFKGMFYWFCNCTVEWTNWTVPQGKESPCRNGICWMCALL